MNFISMKQEQVKAVELKYCERCGGLWLRRRGEEHAHCGRCRENIAKMLSPWQKRGRALRGEAGEVPIECLLGVAEQEVRA